MYHPGVTPHPITILHPTDSYLFLQPELTVHIHTQQIKKEEMKEKEKQTK